MKALFRAMVAAASGCAARQPVPAIPLIDHWGVEGPVHVNGEPFIVRLGVGSGAAESTIDTSTGRLEFRTCTERGELPVVLTPAEIRSIYGKLRDLDFFDRPPRIDAETRAKLPCSPPLKWHVEAVHGARRSRADWESCDIDGREATSAPLQELGSAILAMAADRDPRARMPAADRCEP
jgi:hypothetical protein